MVRLISIFYFLILLSSKSYSQFFGLLHRNPQNNYQTILEYPRDNKHRVLNWIYSSQQQLFKSQILVYNSDLTFSDSISLLKNVIPISVEPIRTNSVLLWPSVFTDTSTFNPSVQQFVVLETDTNYNYKALHALSPMVYSAIQPLNIIKLGSNYYTGFTDFLTSNSKLYKLNGQLAKTDSVTINAKINSLSVQNNSLLISGIGLPCTNSFGHFQKATLDTNLAYVDCFTLNNLYINNGPCTQTIGIWPNSNSLIFSISNTKYFAMGNYDVNYNAACDSWDGMVNFVLDNNNNLIKSEIISNSYTNTSYMDASNTHWCDEGDKILTVGIEGHNFQIGSTVSGQPQTTKIVINKFDTLGNLIWSKRHGGDMYYRTKSVKYTSNGSILIAGMRYDSSSHVLPQGIMENFLLKLDAFGDFSPVSLLEQSLSHTSIKCYPNPADKELFFILPFKHAGSLRIFNLAGEELIQVNPFYTNERINVEGLKPGIYFFTITSSLGVSSGKFIKSYD